MFDLRMLEMLMKQRGMNPFQGGFGGLYAGGPGFAGHRPPVQRPGIPLGAPGMGGMPGYGKPKLPQIPKPPMQMQRNPFQPMPRFGGARKLY